MTLSSATRKTDTDQEVLGLLSLLAGPLCCPPQHLFYRGMSARFRTWVSVGLNWAKLGKCPGLPSWGLAWAPPFLFCLTVQWHDEISWQGGRERSGGWGEEDKGGRCHKASSPARLSLSFLNPLGKGHYSSDSVFTLHFLCSIWVAASGHEKIYSVEWNIVDIYQETKNES